MRETNVSIKQQVQELKSAEIPNGDIVEKLPRGNRDSVRRYLREKPKAFVWLLDY